MRDAPPISVDVYGEGRCFCGCGSMTTVANSTDGRYGAIKGHHMKFVRGHHRRIADQARYRVEMKGYRTPCWLWLGYVGAHGYGHTGTALAHRYFYEKYVGPIPKGLIIHHACGVKVCVNPDHLRPVSKRENASLAAKVVNVRKMTSANVRPSYAREDRGYLNRCWIWQGYIGPTGYGKLGRKLAHRAIYEIHEGRVPEGMSLDHLCGVRYCVNPQHLEAVTQAENVRRGKLGKLTSESVRQIRADDVSTYTDLGEKYGVTSGYIGMIKNRRRWRDVS